MSAKQNNPRFYAYCTHCGKAWEAVTPTAANELRQWPNVAVCPRCGYWAKVREVKDA